MRTKQWFNGMGGRAPLFLGMLGLLLAAAPALTQQAPPPQGLGQAQRPEEWRGRGVAGKITAIKDRALELTRVDGASPAVKLAGKTEYPQERQKAKLGHFQEGD